MRKKCSKNCNKFFVTFEGVIYKVIYKSELLYIC